jgi:hypothetical protein
LEEPVGGSALIQHVPSVKADEWPSLCHCLFGIVGPENSSTSSWRITSSPTRANPVRSIGQWIKSQPLFDRLYAAYENTHWSAREIEPFVRKNHIDMSEFEPIEYRSFAEFFDRRFRRGVRKFPAAPGEMGAFAEARYFAWERWEAEQQFPVKGQSLRPDQILGNAQWAQRFVGGPVFLVRLAPVDYHHVHYCDDGRTLHHDRMGHRLWTVNQHALRSIPFKNERNINILETRGSASWKWKLCRLDASFRFICSAPPIIAAPKSPSFASAARPSSYSVNPARGAQTTISLGTREKASRHSCGSAKLSACGFNVGRFVLENLYCAPAWKDSRLDRPTHAR